MFFTKFKRTNLVQNSVLNHFSLETVATTAHDNFIRAKILNWVMFTCNMLHVPLIWSNVCFISLFVMLVIINFSRNKHPILKAQYIMLKTNLIWTHEKSIVRNGNGAGTLPSCPSIPWPLPHLLSPAPPSHFPRRQGEKSL